MSAKALSQLVLEKYPESTLTRQVIFNIENDRKGDLSIAELFQLSDCLNIPPLALLCDIEDPDKKIEDGPFKGKTNRQVCLFFDVFDEGSDNKRNANLGIINASQNLSKQRERFESAEYLFWGCFDEGESISQEKDLQTYKYFNEMNQASAEATVDFDLLDRSEAYIPSELRTWVNYAMTVTGLLSAQAAESVPEERRSVFGKRISELAADYRKEHHV